MRSEISGALRDAARSAVWCQVSATLYGGHKGKSRASIARSGHSSEHGGYGGHFRAVQGFRYVEGP